MSRVTDCEESGFGMVGEDVRAMVGDLMSLIPAVAATYGAALGVAALVTGWQAVSQRCPRRRRRGVVVPPVGAIAPDVETEGGHP